MPNADLKERIRLHAYQIWEQEGRPEGQVEDHWLRAEAEIANVNPGEEAPPATPSAGEHICPACTGTGRVGRARCKQCGGTGRIIDAPGPPQEKQERQQTDPIPGGSPRDTPKGRDSGRRAGSAT
jgi:hypothetical protein